MGTDDVLSSVAVGANRVAVLVRDVGGAGRRGAQSVIVGSVVGYGFGGLSCATRSARLETVYPAVRERASEGL